MTRLRCSFALAFAFVLSTGAGCWLIGEDDDGSAGPPCEEDFNGCDDDTSAFMVDPTCTLTGELELIIGQGPEQFSALGPDELPEAQFGFQGGQHVWMALQIRNPDLSRPLLKVRVKLDACYNADCTSPSAWQTDNIRELVIDDRTMQVTDEGWFEQAGILVVMFGWDSAPGRRVEMLVTDACGRQALATREQLGG